MQFQFIKILILYILTKKEKFIQFLDSGFSSDYILFQPILMHFAARFIGSDYGKLASDFRVLTEANIRTMDYFDLDWVELISDPYRETSAFGAEIRYIPEGVPICLNHVINSPEDILTLKKPDIFNTPRTLDRIHGAKFYSEQLCGTVPVFGWIEGPLAEACDLAGVSEMLMMLMAEPEYSEKLMDICMVTAKEFALAQINAGCDVIGIGDAICSQVDRDTYDRFVRDRHGELVRFIQEKGARVKIHICGNITHLLPSLSVVKPDILDIDWEVDFREAFRIMGPDVAICGNINPVLIQEAGEKELYTLTRELIASQIDKKFILSGGCEITVNTPVKNLLAMSRACREFSLH